jgi:hypothetical protein
MAGYLTPDGKASALNALAGLGLYVGLAQSLGLVSPPQLTSISEVTTAGYSRQAVTWTSADEVNTFLNNTVATQFGPVTADMPPASYAFLTDAASGVSLDAPVLTGGSASSGGTFAAGQYYWVVTAFNSKGETLASNEVSASLTSNQQKVLSWTAPTVNPAGTAYDVAGYKVYRGTAAGAENVLVTTINNPATLTYTDAGTAGTAGAPGLVSTAAVGKIYYIWEMAEPVSALANKPVYVPANGLIIE